MPMMVIELPLPPRSLHPNSSVSWKAKIKPKREYRKAAYLSTMEEIAKHKTLDGGLMGLPATRATITPIFTHRVNRNRDRDNSLSHMKSGFDGVADAMMMDDHRFIYMPVEFVKGKENRVHLKVEW